jgi:hypothetical protein
MAGDDGGPPAVNIPPGQIAGFLLDHQPAGHQPAGILSFDHERIGHSRGRGSVAGWR